MDGTEIDTRGGTADAASARALLERARALISAAADRLHGSHHGAGGEDALAAHIGIIEVAEQITAAAHGIVARASIAYQQDTLDHQRAAGVPERDLGRGVAEEIALARRISPRHAASQLEQHSALVRTMPRTLGLLDAGEITPWTAGDVARATAALDDHERQEVDARIADQLTAGSALRRHDHEVAARRVSLRPLSDVMSRITMDLPTPQAAAVIGTLDATARGIRAAGGPRTLAQIMADEAFSRITGLTRVESAPIELQLLMTDASLLGGDDTDAASVGDLPIPAAVARRLALGESTQKASPEGEADDAELHGERFIRRLYTDPLSGRLTEADARRRRFTGIERRFVLLRDRRCRAPLCDAPIEHIHHVERYADGGSTTTDNGVGTCAAFNQAVEAPGWSTRARPDGGLEVTTPSGRRITTAPPPLKRSGSSPPDDHSPAISRDFAAAASIADARPARIPARSSAAMP